jgi:hypothetical protein
MLAPSPLPSGRSTIADGAAALVAGVAVAFIRHGVPPGLASPLVCPGVIQRLTTESARLAPDLSAGTVLLTADAGLAVVVVAALSLVAARLSGSSLVGAALGIAAAGWPALGPVLDAANAMTLLATVLTIGGVLITNRRITLAGVVIAALSNPTSALALGGWIALWPRPGIAARRRLLDMGLVAVAGALSVLAAASTGAGAGVADCLGATASMAGFVDHLRSATSGAGPYVLGLALLALVGHRRLPLVVLASAVTGTLLLVWTTDAARPSDGRAVLATLFMLGASGLATLRQACGSSGGGRLAAAFFLVLVPWLHVHAATQRVTAGSAPSWGHRDLSLTTMRARVSHIPSEAGLVEEDVATDGLLAAIPVRPTRVKNDPVRITAALRAGTRIYALPAAQARLRHLGFQLADVDGAVGLATVTLGGECRGIADRWRPLPDLLATSALSLVARDEHEVGPVVVYLAFDTRPAVQPLDWPTPGHRGLYVSVYARTDRVEVAQFETDAVQDGLPREQVPSSAAFLARLELWRAPGAPTVMAADLGARPLWALAQVNDRARPRRITVCPAFPHVVRAIAP